MVVNLQPKFDYYVWIDKDDRTIHIAERNDVPTVLWYTPMTVLGAELPGGIIGKPYAAIPTSKHYPELKLMIELGVKADDITGYCAFYKCPLVTLLSAWSLYKSAINRQPKIKSTYAQNLYTWLHKPSNKRPAPGTRHEIQSACVELWNYTLPVSLGQSAAQQIFAVVKAMLGEQLLTAVVHKPKKAPMELVLESTPEQTPVKEEEIVTARDQPTEIEEPQITMEGIIKCGNDRRALQQERDPVGYFDRGRGR